MTNMSEEPCILVVGADDVHIATSVDAFRAAGWRALGTSNPWEAITLVTDRPISMILQDLGLAGMAVFDFSTLIAEDPALREIPRVHYSPDSSPEELLRTVRSTLAPSFPPEEAARRDTRFVRRRRPAAVSA